MQRGADQEERNRALDRDREQSLCAYLHELQRATAEGVLECGDLHRSLMDNFESIAGYRTATGPVYVNFATQKCTPKLSASLHHEVMARNLMA